MCKENHTICNVYINLTQPMFGSCFTSCMLESACLIYVNCVCVCAQWCPTYIVLCFSFVLFRHVYPKLSASLDCHFWIALWYSLTFNYRRLIFFQNCIWTPTFSAKQYSCQSCLTYQPNVIYFNTVTTNFNGEGGNLSLQILEDRCLSLCLFTVLLRASVLSVHLRFTDCNCL